MSLSYPLVQKSPTKQTRTENGNDVSGLFAESEDEYIDASDGTPEPGEEYESEWAEVIPQAQLDFSEPELLEVATTTVTLGNFQAVTPLDFGTVEHETTAVVRPRIRMFLWTSQQTTHDYSLLFTGQHHRDQPKPGEPDSESAQFSQG